MSLFTRLLGTSEKPKKRVQVCVECGMPVADHKDWCSIRRGLIEMERASAASNQAGNGRLATGPR